MSSSHLNMSLAYDAQSWSPLVGVPGRKNRGGVTGCRWFSCSYARRLSSCRSFSCSYARRLSSRASFSWSASSFRRSSSSWLHRLLCSLACLRIRSPFPHPHLILRREAVALTSLVSVVSSPLAVRSCPHPAASIPGSSVRVAARAHGPSSICVHHHIARRITDALSHGRASGSGHTCRVTRGSVAGWRGAVGVGCTTTHRMACHHSGFRSRGYAVVVRPPVRGCLVPEIGLWPFVGISARAPP
jgi:hypothetical protein